jgi:hypothetical protein
MHASRRQKQAGAARRRRPECRLGLPDVAFLIEVRLGYPLVLVQRMAGGFENDAAINDAKRVIHAKAQTFQNGCEMPRINGHSIDAGLAPNGFEAGAIEEGRQKGVPAQRLIKSGDRGRRPLQRQFDRGIRRRPR